MSSWEIFGERLSVGELQTKAKKELEKLRKQGKNPSPIEAMEGRIIVSTPVGKAWCEHLEAHLDFNYRLDRGRSYLRHGTVIDLQIHGGSVQATVVGTGLHKVSIEVSEILKTHWEKLLKDCAGKLSSAIALLQGEISQEVVGVLARRPGGIFPAPNELVFECSCPDSGWDDLCKHIAAVLYGIGYRIDRDPSLLFALRGVDPQELFTKPSIALLTKKAPTSTKRLERDELENLFGISLEFPTQEEGEAEEAEAEESEPSLPEPAQEMSLESIPTEIRVVDSHSGRELSVSLPPPELLGGVKLPIQSKLSMTDLPNLLINNPWDIAMKNLVQSLRDTGLGSGSAATPTTGGKAPLTSPAGAPKKQKPAPTSPEGASAQPTPAPAPDGAALVKNIKIEGTGKSKLIRHETLLSYQIPRSQIQHWLVRRVLVAAEEPGTYQWTKIFQGVLIDYLTTQRPEPVRVAQEPEKKPPKPKVIKEETLLAYGVPLSQLKIWQTEGILTRFEDEEETSYEWTKALQKTLVHFLAKQKIAAEKHEEAEEAQDAELLEEKASSAPPKEPKNGRPKSHAAPTSPKEEAIPEPKGSKSASKAGAEAKAPQASSTSEEPSTSPSGASSDARIEGLELKTLVAQTERWLRRGHTQAELSRKVGVAQASISQMLQGSRRSISAELAEKIRTVLVSKA